MMCMNGEGEPDWLAVASCGSDGFAPDPQPLCACLDGAACLKPPAARVAARQLVEDVAFASAVPVFYVY